MLPCSAVRCDLTEFVTGNSSHFFVIIGFRYLRFVHAYARIPHAFGPKRVVNSVWLVSECSQALAFLLEHGGS